MSQALRYALAYAERGLAVFPLAHGSKVPPKDLAWRAEATWLDEKITHWFAQRPTPNLAIATGDASGVFVLDVDPRHNGDRSLAEIVAAHGPIVAPTVRTPSGGTHFYFQLTEPLGNRVGLREGIDVRATGGYVAAPPSSIDGQHYTWAASGSGPTAALAPAPEWLLGLIRRPPPPARTNAPPQPPRTLAEFVTAALKGEREAVANARPGNRNNRLNEASFNLGQLSAHGLDRSVAFDTLVEAAEIVGLEGPGVAATFASGWGAGERRPRVIRQRTMGRNT